MRRLTAALRVADALISAGEIVDSALCRLPFYRWPRDVVLDTVLGPADSFEYVSTTAPAGPPPTIS